MNGLRNRTVWSARKWRQEWLTSLAIGDSCASGAGPTAAKIALSVGLALEDFKYQSQVRTEGPPGKIGHFSLSYSEYGYKVGIWRILDLLDEFGIKANMSTSGLSAPPQHSDP